MQHGVPCQMPEAIVDLFEMVDVDHQQGETATQALRACELFAQPRLQIAAVVKPGEKIGKAAAQQARAVNPVFQTYRAHEPKMREKIGSKLRSKARFVGAAEHQHAFDRIVLTHRNDCNAAEALDSRKEPRMQLLPVATEPWLLKTFGHGGKLRKAVDEQHLAPLLLHDRIAPQQVADLVPRIAQRQHDGLELIGSLEIVEQDLEQICQRRRAQQLELPLLGLLQNRLIAHHL